MPDPTLALTKVAPTAPLTVALSPDKTPYAIGVPLTVAAIDALKTLFATDNPLIVTGAGVILAVNVVSTPTMM